MTKLNMFSLYTYFPKKN